MEECSSSPAGHSGYFGCKHGVMIFFGRLHLLCAWTTPHQHYDDTLCMVPDKLYILRPLKVNSEWVTHEFLLNIPFEYTPVFTERKTKFFRTVSLSCRILILFRLFRSAALNEIKFFSAAGSRTLEAPGLFKCY